MIELMGDCDSNDNLNGNQCNGLYDLFKDEMSELGESSLDWWHEEVDKSSQNGLSSRDGGSQSPVFKTPQLSLKIRRCRKGFIGSQSTSGLKRFRGKFSLSYIS
ncbi:hypothetical protein C0J52_16639 [Blattella germanica]|nr:hypothetical protein C0J52_16639 [Blattella germanica]